MLLSRTYQYWQDITFQPVSNSFLLYPSLSKSIYISTKAHRGKSYSYFTAMICSARISVSPPTPASQYCNKINLRCTTLRSVAVESVRKIGNAAALQCSMNEAWIIMISKINQGENANMICPGLYRSIIFTINRFKSQVQVIHNDSFPRSFQVFLNNWK